AGMLPGTSLAWGAQPPRLHRSAPRRPDRVFGKGAEHCTRGACAPHAKHIPCRQTVLSRIAALCRQDAGSTLTKYPNRDAASDGQSPPVEPVRLQIMNKTGGNVNKSSHKRNPVVTRARYFAIRE